MLLSKVILMGENIEIPFKNVPNALRLIHSLIH